MVANIKGAITALITPFKEDFSVDYEGFAKFVNWQINEGIDGLVPCGTTGENSTLSFEEYCHIIDLCVSVTEKRVPVIPGTGSNSTSESIRRTQYAESVGADAALVVVPYYNKPTQESIYHHFKKIHDESNIPLIIYNVPGRCVVDASDSIIARIMLLPRVVGLKDATGDLVRVLSLRKLISDQKIALLSGEDSTGVAFCLYGGSGCISVLSNVVPKACSTMYRLFFDNNITGALEINDSLFQLAEILFCESNPIPVKYAVSLLNSYLSSRLRLPLMTLSDDNRVILRNIMIKLNLL